MTAALQTALGDNQMNGNAIIEELSPITQPASTGQTLPAAIPAPEAS